MARYITYLDITTTTQKSNPHRAEQGERPAIPTQAAIEKYSTEENKKKKNIILLKASKRIQIGTLNMQNKTFKIPQLIASAKATGQDIICIQEHRFIHEDITIKEQTYDKWKLLTLSAWKNSTNAATGGIGMLVSNQAYNTITSIEMVSHYENKLRIMKIRIMKINFQGNP